MGDDEKQIRLKGSRYEKLDLAPYEAALEEALDGKRPLPPTTIQQLAKLRPKVVALRAKGYTLEAIAQMLPGIPSGALEGLFRKRKRPPKAAKAGALAPESKPGSHKKKPEKTPASPAKSAPAPGPSGNGAAHGHDDAVVEDAATSPVADESAPSSAEASTMPTSPSSFDPNSFAGIRRQNMRT